jgi:F-type H+-transporting ATPase subunit b
VILRALLFKPVTKCIETRREKIKSDLESAARDHDEARTLRSTYEAALRGAEDEARKIVQDARKSAEERAEAIVAEGKAEALSQLDRARRQIAAERDAAFISFKAEAASLVVRAASKLLERELSGEDALRLAESAVRECAAPAEGRAS